MPCQGLHSCRVETWPGPVSPCGQAGVQRHDRCRERPHATVFQPDSGNVFQLPDSCTVLICCSAEHCSDRMSAENITWFCGGWCFRGGSAGHCRSLWGWYFVPEPAVTAVTAFHKHAVHSFRQAFSNGVQPHYCCEGKTCRHPCSDGVGAVSTPCHICFHKDKCFKLYSCGLVVWWFGGLLSLGLRSRAWLPSC